MENATIHNDGGNRWLLRLGLLSLAIIALFLVYQKNYNKPANMPSFGSATHAGTSALPAAEALLAWETGLVAATTLAEWETVLEPNLEKIGNALENANPTTIVATFKAIAEPTLVTARSKIQPKSMLDWHALAGHMAGMVICGPLNQSMRQAYLALYTATGLTMADETVASMAAGEPPAWRISNNPYTHDFVVIGVNSIVCGGTCTTKAEKKALYETNKAAFPTARTGLMWEKHPPGCL